MVKKKLKVKPLSKKVTSKRILKPNKATVTIKKFEPAPYVSRYFKEEMEETKKSMFGI